MKQDESPEHRAVGTQRPLLAAYTAPLAAKHHLALKHVGLGTDRRLQKKRVRIVTSPPQLKKTKQHHFLDEEPYHAI